MQPRAGKSAQPPTPMNRPTPGPWNGGDGTSGSQFRNQLGSMMRPPPPPMQKSGFAAGLQTALGGVGGMMPGMQPRPQDAMGMTGIQGGPKIGRAHV